MALHEGVRYVVQSLSQFFDKLNADVYEFAESYNEHNGGALLEEANYYREIDGVDKVSDVSELAEDEILTIADESMLSIVDYVLDAREQDYVMLSNGYDTYSIIRIEI